MSPINMGLANAAEALGWSEQGIIDLLIARRRKARAKSKGARYYERTARRALEKQSQRRKVSRCDDNTIHKKGNGSGGGKSPFTREEEIAAVERYIDRVEAGKEVVHWTG